MFFSKNDKDSHQKCSFFYDFDEKRNGFLIVFVFFLKNDKDSHQKCSFFYDFDEKRNVFLTVSVFFLKTIRILTKIEIVLVILMKNIKDSHQNCNCFFFTIRLLWKSDIFYNLWWKALIVMSDMSVCLFWLGWGPLEEDNFLCVSLWIFAREGFPPNTLQISLEASQILPL